MEQTNTTQATVEKMVNAIVPDDAAATAKPIETPETYSAQLHKLSREQRKFRDEMKLERAKFDAEIKAERDKVLSELNSEREKAKAPKENKTPIEALMDAGYTYQQATEYVIEHGVPTTEDTIKKVESKVERLIRENEERDQRAKEEAKQAQDREAKEAKNREEQAKQSFVSDIDQFLKANSEKYEFTAIYATKEDLYDLIEKHYQRSCEPDENGESNPKILSIDEAAELMESNLEEMFKKGQSTKKYQAWNGKGPDPKQSVTTPTLSQSFTAGASKPMTSSGDRSDEDRRAAALAILSR